MPREWYFNATMLNADKQLKEQLEQGEQLRHFG